MVMNTTEANMLRPELISEQDCWRLMSQVAFQKKRKDDVHKFENIGREIAKKCKGLPLAAKTLGGLLILKDTITEWKEVLKSEIWELEKAETQLFPHLFLSYAALPATLKRCFIFYSIFPKDYKINVEELISLWIGHGYINPTKQIYDPEHVGREYFRYLVSRSFFEVEVDDLFDSSTNYASMHDIMHDFALHISRNNFLTITRDGNNSDSGSLKHHKFKKAHHLLIEDKDPSTMCDVGRLRTCLAKSVPRDVTLGMFRHLKLLRTLSLRWCDLDQIPPEIGKLIHLRTLDLSYNRSLGELPETIGDLYNLKYIFLENVKLKKFPQSIGKLINLRILTVENWELLAPESLGKLVNLQELGRVRVEAGLRGLGFLKNLNQLHEHLEIVFESDYIDDVDANEANLKGKKHVKKLTSDFNGKDVVEAVVKALKPSTHVKVVKIVNFRGTKLPSWITSLNNLTVLKVSLSQNIVSLPSLGKLPFLEMLKIHKLSALKFIGRDFLGIDNTREIIEDASPSSIIAFPALEELELSSLDEFEKWEDLKVEKEDMTNAMPQLKILTIKGCPKLRVMPLRLLRKESFMERLKVDKIELPSNLMYAGEEVTEGIVRPLLPRSLQYLHIEEYMGPRLPSWICCLNYLTSLELHGAAEVESLPPLGKLPVLEHLSITNFSSLEFIGREFLGIDIKKKVNTSTAEAASSSSSIAYFPKLIELRLFRLYKLKEWEDIRLEEDTSVHVMPNLKNMLIFQCPSLVVLPHRLFHKASLLRKLSFKDDERRTQKCSSSSFEASFGTMVLAIPKLQGFTIWGLMDTKLPSWITSLDNLTSLYLSYAKNVTSLPPLGKLPCLLFLHIEILLALKFVGREFLGIEDDSNQKNNITTPITCFPKLRTLRIWSCAELEAWEDIRVEEDVDDAITLMSNLTRLSIHDCPKLQVLPNRLLQRHHHL